MEFRTNLGETIFKTKYASNPYETWNDRAHTVVNYVCGDMDGEKNSLMAKSDRDQLASLFQSLSSCLVEGTSGTQGEMRGSLTTATYSSSKRIPERSGLGLREERCLA